MSAGATGATGAASSSSSASFASSLVTNVVLPNYQTQLQNGLTLQNYWQNAAYVLSILAELLSGVATVLGGYTMYSGDMFYTLLFTSFNVSSHVATGFSSWCVGQEKQTAANNQQILTAVGANVTLPQPVEPAEASDNEVSVVSQAVASVATGATAV